MDLTPRSARFNDTQSARCRPLRKGSLLFWKFLPEIQVLFGRFNRHRCALALSSCCCRPGGAPWAPKWSRLPPPSGFHTFFGSREMWLDLARRRKVGFTCPAAVFAQRGDAESRGGWNLGCALARHGRCLRASIEAAPFCHGASVRGEFARSTMGERKTVFLLLLLAAQLRLSSTQVLRIGKRNSCLRTAPTGCERSGHHLSTITTGLSCLKYVIVVNTILSVTFKFY